jgi:hypothetical protein
MTEMPLTKVNYNRTEKNLLVDPRLKICVECGYPKVDYYEFGISCENCGVFLLFAPIKEGYRKWRELRK